MIAARREVRPGAVHTSPTVIIAAVALFFSER